MLLTAHPAWEGQQCDDVCRRLLCALLQMLATLEQRMAAPDAARDVLAAPLAAVVCASLLELPTEAAPHSPQQQQQQKQQDSSGSQDADSGAVMNGAKSLQGLPHAALQLAAALQPQAPCLAAMIGGGLSQLVRQLEVEMLLWGVSKT